MEQKQQQNQKSNIKQIQYSSIDYQDMNILTDMKRLEEMLKGQLLVFIFRINEVYKLYKQSAELEMSKLKETVQKLKLTVQTLKSNKNQLQEIIEQKQKLLAVKCTNQYLKLIEQNKQTERQKDKYSEMMSTYECSEIKQKKQQKINKNETQYEQLQNENNRNIEQVQQLKEQIARIQQQLQTHIKLNQTIMEEKLQIQKEKYNIINQRNIQLETAKNNCQMLKVIEAESKINKQQIQQIKKQNLDLKQKCQEIKNNCKLDIQSIKTQYLKNIEKEKEKIEVLIAEITELRRENSEIKEENKQLQKNFRNEEKHSLKLKQQNQQLKIQLQTTTEKIALLRGEKQSGEYLHIFEGETIRNRDIQAKQFLRRSIEEYMNRTIEYTRKVYKYDTLNKISFHSYVDGVPFLCTVIRTVNDDLLAAFSVDPLRSNVVIGSQGLLVSMTNSTVYRCQQGRRSMTYDDFFLIYGNSEMRIRMGDNKLFSNFGLNGGYFESRGDNVDIYIGSNTNRETYFVTYEVYEIIFNEK